MSTKFDLNRREFLKTSSLALAGATALNSFSFIQTAHAAPDDPIRAAVIGCGGRGTGAALNLLQAATHVIYPLSEYHTEDAAENARVNAKNVQVVALADLFQDRMDRCRMNLDKLGVKIADDHCFVGWDAYQKVLAIPEINYVILATPPHFRPVQLKAAIEAGKHVFMEKPVAVDGPGVRMVIEAGELAAQKGLGIVGGTQRRHDQGYQETVKRLQDGAIGEIHTARVYWNGGVIWAIKREEGWSDMEWQLRNWCYFTWLSGDHIVEQHVHNLDVAHWIMGGHPVVANALGGRQTRQGELHGHIYDHFAVEYEYANGAHMYSQCRQMDGVPSRVGEFVEGTKGVSDCVSMIKTADGNVWKYPQKAPNPYEQEHLDLINSIRNGQPLNEARAIAESTLIGIMGRESAYTGRPITWDEALNSKTRLGPDTYAFGPYPFPEVPMPGKHEFA